MRCSGLFIHPPFLRCPPSTLPHTSLALAAASIPTGGPQPPRQVAAPLLSLSSTPGRRGHGSDPYAGPLSLAACSFLSLHTRGVQRRKKASKEGHAGHKCNHVPSAAIQPNRGVGLCLGVSSGLATDAVARERASWTGSPEHCPCLPDPRGGGKLQTGILDAVEWNHVERRFRPLHRRAMAKFRPSFFRFRSQGQLLLAHAPVSPRIVHVAARAYAARREERPEA